MCRGRSTPYLGDKLIPPKMTEILIIGILTPIELMTIPYYMEIIGVDRPDCTHVFLETLEFAQLKVLNADTILGLEVTCKPFSFELKTSNSESHSLTQPKEV